jgi:hypothetical protein
MGAKLLRIPDELTCARDQFGVFDHFNEFVTGDVWTSAVAGTGTVLHEGPGRSRMALFSTADNDAAVLPTTHELFKFVSGKAIMAEAVVQYTEVNTDDSSVGFGFADAMAATTLADDTGAVAATDALLIFKVKNSTIWQFHTEINGVATTTASTTTAGGSAAQTLRIEVTPRNSTELECRPFVDGVQLKDSSGNKIMHVVTLGTATDMDFGLVVKGHHANDLTVYTDYVFAAQAR